MIQHYTIELIFDRTLRDSQAFVPYIDGFTEFRCIVNGQAPIELELENVARNTFRPRGVNGYYYTHEHKNHHFVYELDAEDFDTGKIKFDTYGNEIFYGDYVSIDIMYYDGKAYEPEEDWTETASN